jgi:hypothetical protein
MMPDDNDNVIQFPINDDQRAQNDPGMMYELLPPGMQYIVSQELQMYTDAAAIKQRIIRLKQAIPPLHETLRQLQDEVKGLDIVPHDIQDTIDRLRLQLQGKIASIGLLRSKLEQMGDPNA